MNLVALANEISLRDFQLLAAYDSVWYKRDELKKKLVFKKTKANIKKKNRSQ